MDACSCLKAFRRGEEDELLSVKKVRLIVGGRYIQLDISISLKESEI